jgi:hypothetical protein
LVRFRFATHYNQQLKPLNGALGYSISRKYLKLLLFLSILLFSNLSFSQSSCPVLDLMYQNNERIGFEPIYLGMKLLPSDYYKFDSPSQVGEHCGVYSVTYTKESFPIRLILDSEFKVLDIHISTASMSCDKDTLVVTANNTFKKMTFLKSRHNNLTELETNEPGYIIGEPKVGILMLKPSRFVSVGKIQCYD